MASTTTVAATSARHHIAVRTGDPVKRQGPLFGLFFEDLNHAADGGLYAELVRNRSFEFDPIDNPDYTPLTGWTVLGDEHDANGDAEATQSAPHPALARIGATHPLNADNPHYLVLGPSDAELAGVANAGFNGGIPVTAGASYAFSCFARIDGQSAAATATLRVELRSADLSAIHASASFDLVPGVWQRYAADLVPNVTDPAAILVVRCDQKATLDLDMISLIPHDTFDDEHVFRRDLTEKIADMHPRFLRFPGGCLIHDGSFDASDRDAAYRWKFTVGPVERRPSKRNRWKYNQTFGLGFYEYFRLCEMIGAEPVPVLSLGCNSHIDAAVPMDALQEWIDDALDLIEFANGPADSAWGRVRADMGHPEPFGLKYLALGNEEEYPEFYERFEEAVRQIHERHPEIVIAGSAGVSPHADTYDPSYAQADRLGVPLMDEHYYQSPEWLVMNARRYERHPYHAKAFIGEYATLDDTWFNALAEAAFMTGLERTPAVAMACYAPLFNNVKYTNWKPDLIQFDGCRSYGTPSYWAQWLFMRNQGEELLGTSDDVAHREIDAWPMRGTASIRVQGAYMTIDDLTIRTLNTDNPTMLTRIDHAELRPDGERLLPLDTGDGEGFHLEFDFTVPQLPTNPGPGDTDIVIRFAGSGEDDYAAVTINGVWGRMLTLSTVEHGKESPYAMDHCKCLPEERHHAVLDADCGHVTFRLDGRMVFNQRLTPYAPDDLYYSAVRDEDGTIVVKLVNVTDVPVDVRLDFDHAVDSTIDVERMDGFALDARNDFEHPERVSPVPRRVTVADGAASGAVTEFDYALPPRAIHVLRLRVR